MTPAVSSVFRGRNLRISGGCVAANGVNCVFENCTIDATAISGNLFAAVTKSTFRSVVVSNDGSATLQNLCGNNTWINCSAAPSVLNTAGTSPHIYLESTFNSITYRLNSIEAAVAYNPGTIAGGALQDDRDRHRGSSGGLRSSVLRGYPDARG